MGKACEISKSVVEMGSRIGRKEEDGMWLLA
jgi:hypothetical protein